MTKKKLFSIVLLCFVIIVFVSACRFSIEDTNLSIHIIDVGQGDSVFIKTPKGKTILIDGGEYYAGEKVVSYLKKQKVKEIDILIATHPHSDHIGGLIHVIEKFPIKNFYMPYKIHTSKTYEKLLETVEKKHLKINAATNDIFIFLEEDISLYFLGPLKDYGDNLNNWSAVVKIDYNTKSFLFTGDIEYLVEEDLLITYDSNFLQSQFLKVAHHGSNTSSSQKFLQTVQPKVAVLSYGKDNPYYHPHKEVLDRLKALNIAIYSTEKQGDIVIKSDGNRIWSHQKPYYP